ncbi:MAG: hypothetical protein ACT4PT_03170 [Methanobacteriota archaeon]
MADDHELAIGVLHIDGPLLDAIGSIAEKFRSWTVYQVRWAFAMRVAESLREFLMGLPASPPVDAGRPTADEGPEEANEPTEDEDTDAQEEDDDDEGSDGMSDAKLKKMFSAFWELSSGPVVVEKIDVRIQASPLRAPRAFVVEVSNAMKQLLASFRDALAWLFGLLQPHTWIPGLRRLIKAGQTRGLIGKIIAVLAVIVLASLLAIGWVVRTANPGRFLGKLIQALNLDLPEIE